MKIGFISPADVNDKTTWSGITYYLYKHLKEKCDNVILVSPIAVENVFLNKIFTLITRICSKVRGKQCLNIYHSFYLAKAQGRFIDKFLGNLEIDYIISTTYGPFVYSKINVPLILITDATVKLLYDEYKGGVGWSELFYLTLEKNAKKVTQKSVLIISSSKTTTDSLVNYYQIPASKVSTIPFGANFDNTPIQSMPRNIERTGRVNFLFVGVDWERKGGEVAVAICDELLRQNVQVGLTIVGCKVPDKYRRSYLKNYIFLNKNNNDDSSVLKKLYEESHFFMVFSKAEMYGIVFCEAAAYGLPVITYSVGGIPDIVVNNVTGIALPGNTANEVFIEKILSLISDPEEYSKMSESAIKRYQSLLNWDVFTDSLIRNIKKLRS